MVTLAASGVMFALGYALRCTAVMAIGAVLFVLAVLLYTL